MDRNGSPLHLHDCGVVSSHSLPKGSVKVAVRAFLFEFLDNVQILMHHLLKQELSIGLVVETLDFLQLSVVVVLVGLKGIDKVVKAVDLAF